MFYANANKQDGGEQAKYGNLPKHKLGYQNKDKECGYQSNLEDNYQDNTLVFYLIVPSLL